jgi:hypothetical protein
LDSLSASVYVFEGVPISEDVGMGTVDFDMSQSPTSGQITGYGSMSVSIPYADSSLSGTADLDGNMTFSAKPVKRGSVVTLSGAKLSSSVNGTASIYVYAYYRSYYVYCSAKETFLFNALNVDISRSSPLLYGSIKAGKISIKASGVIEGRSLQRTVSIPYTSESFSEEVSADNIWKLNIGVSQLAVSSKGAVTGYADSLVDMADTVAYGYKVSGTRNSKTSITKLTITGVSSSVKGTSAKVNVDDDLNLKIGSGYSNSLSVYGYSMSF